jgi:hypothetical protein
LKSKNINQIQVGMNEFILVANLYLCLKHFLKSIKERPLLNWLADTFKVNVLTEGLTKSKKSDKPKQDWEKKNLTGNAAASIV